jgi:hypothetical protein
VEPFAFADASEVAFNAAYGSMGLWSGWMAPRMQQKAMVKLPLEELAGESLAGEERSPLEGGAVEGRWRGAARLLDGWRGGGEPRGGAVEGRRGGAWERARVLVGDPAATRPPASSYRPRPLRVKLACGWPLPAEPTPASSLPA